MLKQQNSSLTAQLASTQAKLSTVIQDREKAVADKESTQGLAKEMVTVNEQLVKSLKRSQNHLKRIPPAVSHVEGVNEKRKKERATAKSQQPSPKENSAMQANTVAAAPAPTHMYSYKPRPPQTVKGTGTQDFFREGIIPSVYEFLQ